MANPSARDNLHTRVVVALKVTLPLVALAILSTLFLFSRGINPEDAIPYADVDIADRLAQPRMTGAGYSTMTGDGASLTLGAAEAVPEATGGSARGLTGALETPDGARTEIAALSARLNDTERRIDLTDGVELRTSTGYVISAKGLGIGTDRTWLESQGGVAATGPLGQLTAGGLRLDQTGVNGPYLLVFKDGVRLLYQPKN